MKPLLIVGAISLLMLFGCGNSAPTEQAKPKLVAEQIIQYTGNNYACRTKDLFSTASLHAYRKEETKFRAMFQNSDCVVLPKNVDFKVLSIVDRSSEFDIIEITNANNLNGANGLFAGWDY